ncbi:MAG: arginine--tRNA ligase [Planctomycetes bacterium]|nr:arginine--tRNA ligase [Planctomycetota bacterium]
MSINEFNIYEQEIIKEIEITKERIKKEQGRKLPVLSDYVFYQIKSSLENLIKEELSLNITPEIDLIFPPAHINNDLSFGVFGLAKELKINPNILAQSLVEAINKSKLKFITQAVVLGAFINIDLERVIIYQKLLNEIDALKQEYGNNNSYQGQTVLIDYSAPNIAKPIGVGHLRSTIIGQTLANIYSAVGYNVIKDNHLGDWGTQFGSLIYAYQNWGDEEKVNKDPIRELKNLYVLFHKESEEKPELKDKARELFVRLEQKDPELMALWKRFRDLSLIDFKRVYDLLGVSFDTNIGESYFNEEAEKIADECLVKKVCRLDESGAVVVDPIGYLPSFLLRKQDGSSLYLTRDLATIAFRVKTFNPEVILYVVGNEQSLHFQQFFAFGRLAGYIPEKIKTEHIDFGMVLSGGKKMSTRRGTLIELDDLINQSQEKAKEIILAKNREINIKELEKIVKIISIGAIIYNDLRQTRTNNISFDWDKMLDFEGGSAVYLQYTCVRISSIIKKFEEVYGQIKNNEFIFVENSEFSLAKKLMLFPELIMKCQKVNYSHHLCVYLEELAQTFNTFYNDVSILKTEDKALRNSRLVLIESVAIVLRKGLSLLNIKVPDKM